MHLTRRLVPLLALPALGAGILLASGASAQAPAARTLSFKELEKRGTFTHVRNTKTRSQLANSQGDGIVSTVPLADRSGKVVGRLHADCTTTTGARDFRKSELMCSGALVLRDGTLTLHAVTSPGSSMTTGTVTGGTGAYANARGLFHSEGAPGGAQQTITLAG
ncbi:MAG: hypothetical protein ACR2L8_09200 [Solirubrobacteraceae bacterium]